VCRLGIDQRDHYVLEYADQLQSDPGLWRITVSYLYTCGQIGAERADQVLLHVPLQLGSAPAPDGMQEDSDAAQGSVVVGVLQELNEAARRYEREETRRSICKVRI
jgi:nuclear pore complex protein Nup85